MKNIRHVLAFEYMAIVKTKAFVITLALLMVVAAGVSFLPVIATFFGGMFGGGQGAEQVAVIDRAGVFDPDLLLQYAPNNDFVYYTIYDVNYITQAVEDGRYSVGLYFVDQLSYMIIFQSTLAGRPAGMGWVDQMVYNQYREQFLDTHELDIYTLDIIEQLDAINTTPFFVAVGGAGFLLGFIANFIVFFPLTFSGSGVGMAVINEKTNKTIELLFSSTKPTVIIVGKVIAATLAIFTQLIGIVCAGLLGLYLTDSNILQFFSPEILAQLAEPHIYVYIVIFFVLAFFSFTFLFAGFAATARDAQEAQNVILIPTLILVGSFLIGNEIAMGAGWLTTNLTNMFSFLPFVSPLAMIIRITAFVVEPTQILLSIFANIVYVCAVAFFSITIYKRNIMRYGQKPSLLSRLRARFER